MKKILLLLIILSFVINLPAQKISQNEDSEKGKHVHEINQAFEIESLVPLFLTGGYHAAIGYRYQKWRIRASIINGGKYNAESVGINNSSDNFKRYYKTSPGVFLGYNVWKDLDIYGFLESHTFEIEQKNTGIKKDIHSMDFGGGVGYQFFIGRHFYLQPAIHIYLRTNKSLDFNGITYNIPNVDISPVFRVGYRLWSK